MVFSLSGVEPSSKAHMTSSFSAVSSSGSGSTPCLNGFGLSGAGSAELTRSQPIRPAPRPSTTTARTIQDCLRFMAPAPSASGDAALVGQDADPDNLKPVRSGILTHGPHTILSI